jgi:hypothetical protein
MREGASLFFNSRRKYQKQLAKQEERILAAIQGLSTSPPKATDLA